MKEHFGTAKIGLFSGKSSFFRRSACGMGENTVYSIGTLLWCEVVLHLSGSGFFQCVNKRSHRFFFLFDCKVTNYSQNCKYVADKTTAEMAIVFGLLEVMVMLF